MNQDEISEHRALIRREFPVEKIPPLIDPKGRVSANAARMRFSAVGCPKADPEVLRALVKSGVSVDQAFRLTILAAHAADLLIEPLERYAAAVVECSKIEACQRHPYSKYAEERAAKLEGRASRWGTDDFHRTHDRDALTTQYYPYREAQS